MAEMKSAGLGVSTVVAIGADAVKGIDFREPLALFDADPETKAIVLLGEIGGHVLGVPGKRWRAERRGAADLEASPGIEPGCKDLQSSA